MQVVILTAGKSREQRQREAAEARALRARLDALTVQGQRRSAIVDAANNSLITMNMQLIRHDKTRKAIAIGYCVFLSCLPSITLAATNGDGGTNMLMLVQKASFWIGLCVVAWGIIEWQMDLPGWKERIKRGVLGYIAILILPIIFVTLRDNLQIDMWKKLMNQ